MSNFYLPVFLEDDSQCNGCPALLDCYDDGDYECTASKCRHIQYIRDCEDIEDVKRPDWCPMMQCLKEKEA